MHLAPAPQRRRLAQRSSRRHRGWRGSALVPAAACVKGTGWCLPSQGGTHRHSHLTREPAEQDALQGGHPSFKAGREDSPLLC